MIFRSFREKIITLQLYYLYRPNQLTHKNKTL